MGIGPGGGSHSIDEADRREERCNLFLTGDV